MLWIKNHISGGILSIHFTQPDHSNHITEDLYILQFWSNAPIYCTVAVCIVCIVPSLRPEITLLIIIYSQILNT